MQVLAPNDLKIYWRQNFSSRHSSAEHLHSAAAAAAVVAVSVVQLCVCATKTHDGRLGWSWPSTFPLAVGQASAWRLQSFAG